MKTVKITRVTEEPKLVIEYDQGLESPREWTNLGYFITIDRNYSSPDKNETIESIIKETSEEAENQNDQMEMITKRINEETSEKVLAIFPITKYEHSGVSYSLGTVHNWDYSNDGFYIVTDKTQKEVGTEKQDFEKVIKDEIDTYNQYINGEVYGFTLYDDNGETADSCWGIYDLETIRENLPEEWKDEDLTEYIKN